MCADAPEAVLATCIHAHSSRLVSDTPSFDGMKQGIAVWLWAILVVVLVASLAGAVLGGLAGMRFHRAVDRTGLDR